MPDKRESKLNIFLISRRKHKLWYSLEAPRRGASDEYPQHMFSLRNKKNNNTFLVEEKSALSRALNCLGLSIKTESCLWEPEKLF